MTGTEWEEAYLELRRRGFGPHTAAREVGSTAREVAAYAAADPAFRDAVEAAVGEALERVANKAFQRAHEGSEVMLRFILETHGGPDWNKPDREVTLRLGQAPDIDVDELAARLSAAEKRLAIEATATEVAADESAE